MSGLAFLTLTLLVVAGAAAEEEKAGAEVSTSKGEQDTRIYSQNPALASEGQVVGVSSTHGVLLHGNRAQGLVDILNNLAGRKPGQIDFPGQGGVHHPGQGGRQPGSSFPGHGVHTEPGGHGGHGGNPGHGSRPGHGGHGGYPGHGSRPGHGGHGGHGGYPGHGGIPGHGGYPGHGSHPGQGGYPGHGGHPGHGGYPGHGGHPGHGGYPGHGGHPGSGGGYPGHGGHPGSGGGYPGHGGHPGSGGGYPGHGGHPGSGGGGGYPGHGGGHGSPCQDHRPSRPVTSCKYFCKTPCGELMCCEDSNNPYTTTQRPTNRPGKCPPVRPGCPDHTRLRPPTSCAHDGYCHNPQEKCCWDACLKFSTCKLAERYYG